MGAVMRYQPQGRIRIEPANPLSRGFVAYMPLTGKSYFDVVDGSAWAVSAGTSPVAYDGAPRGLGLRIKGATPAYVTKPIPAGIAASATQPLTFRFRLYFHAVSNTHGIMSWGDTSQDGSPRYYVRLSGTNLNIFFSGGYHYSIPVVPEREYIVTDTFDGVLHSLYLNGVLVGTSGGAWGGTTGALYLGIGYDGQQASSDFLLSDFALWNRALTPQEVASDAQNPWQVFAAPEEEEPADIGGGTPTTVTGTYAATLAAPALAAAGAQINAGSFAATLGSVTLAASGSVAANPSGSLAATLGSLTMSASGAVLNPGSFAATLGNPVFSATGAANPHATGSLAATLGNVTMSASGFLGAVAPAAPVRPYRWRVLRRHFTQ